MPDIRQLRQFIAVAEEKHFRIAADRLHMTQPPLSMAIRKLEEELGVILLSRTRKKVELTSAGQVFLKGAYETLERMEALEKDTKRAAQGLIGKLSIGFSGSAIYEALPVSIRRFRRSYPHIQLDITEMSTLSQIEAMLKGNLDIGLLRPPISNDSLFVLYPLRVEQMVIAMPTTHPLARAKKIHLQDFADEDFITFAPETSPNLHNLVFKACADAGFIPRISQTAPQIQTHISLASAGLGVALVPECASRITHPNVTFRYFEDDGEELRTTMSIATHRLTSNAIAQAFIRTCAPEEPKSGYSLISATLPPPDMTPD
ncbi:LysR family transcriptional regulator [Sneathiella limimaris]|uniref:LysR family transcriptional regulator n=1 Tax=Sneathiella limimaris TaxID=1964213 RepID=UPI00146DE7B1|nr:LysR family transcriptional regulator [Sneathiella limimaris]